MWIRRADEQVPLSAFAKFASTTAPLTVNHQGLFPAVTVSFNLKPGVALGDAVNAIDGRGGEGRASGNRSRRNSPAPHKPTKPRSPPNQS